jgi:DNA topoisomerase-1
LRPTDLGVVVCDKLVEGFPDIFQVKFTAHMEADLDKVEDATMDWVAVLHEFYGPFKARLDVAAESMTHAKAETQPSDHDCPECGAKMEYRFGKNGKFLSCTKYPDCKAAMPIDRDGNPAGIEITDVACPLCGTATVLRKGRFGPFLSCSDYPECKGIVKLDKKGLVKFPSAPPLGIDMPCEKCGGDTMNLRRGKRGPWISCAKYPKCRGRAAWKPIEDEKKKQLEADLEAHEAANPQPPIKSVTGELLPEGHTPVITEEERPTPPKPKAEPKPEASDK